MSTALIFISFYTRQKRKSGNDPPLAPKIVCFGLHAVLQSNFRFFLHTLYLIDETS
jgi:hypothetical protein